MFYSDWKHYHLTENSDSWIAVEREVLKISFEEFDALWSLAPPERPTGVIFNKPVTFPRYTAAFGRDYTFAGQTAESLSIDKAPGYTHYAKWMSDANLNGVLVNWYDASDGDYIGLHSDDEKDLCENSPIISITWTSTNTHFRRFRLKPKNSAGLFPSFGDGPGIISLRNGDAIVMGGTCQKTHKHEIMKPRKTCVNESNGRRINITLRRFK